MHYSEADFSEADFGPDGDMDGIPGCSIYYEPLSSPLADTTHLHEDLACRFMKAANIASSVQITDFESQKLHELDKGLEAIFNVSPGMGISTINQEDIVLENPQFKLTRSSWDPNSYTVYMSETVTKLDEESGLGGVNRALKDALKEVLRQEKMYLLPRFSMVDMGVFSLRFPVSRPTFRPDHYIAGRIFLAKHGHEFIVPNENQSATPS